MKIYSGNFPVGTSLRFRQELHTVESTGALQDSLFSPAKILLIFCKDFVAKPTVYSGD